MTKARTERTGNPVTTAVPWNAPEVSQIQDLEAEFERHPDVTFAPPSNVEAIKADLIGQPVAQKSPFAPKPKPAVKDEKVSFEMGDAPSWGDLVRFVQKHGDVIIQVRHPQPRGECIDTLWRGASVFTHETCQLRHVKLGWIDWQDAQYE